MQTKIFISFFAFFILTSLVLTEAKENHLELRNKLKRNFAEEAVLSCYIQPCSLQGDFDGDGKIDEAILISGKKNQKKGIALIFANGQSTYIGAGKIIGNGGDNFDWVDAWHLYKKQKVDQGATDEKPPILKGEVLHVEKSQAASAIIYWNGTSFSWYQQGD